MTDELEKQILERAIEFAKCASKHMRAKGEAGEEPAFMNDIVIEAAEESIALQEVFDMRWKADMRAKKRWQDANPSNDLVWPDRADLVVWLLDELHKLATPDNTQNKS